MNKLGLMFLNNNEKSKTPIAKTVVFPCGFWILLEAIITEIPAKITNWESVELIFTNGTNLERSCNIE